MNVAFALFLAYLEGRLAQRLLTSDWVRVLGRRWPTWLAEAEARTRAKLADGWVMIEQVIVAIVPRRGQFAPMFPDLAMGSLWR